MKQHRFYIQETELTQILWIDDERLVHQWLDVLRFQLGSQLVLFDGESEERLYETIKIGNKAVELRLVTELVRRVPSRDVYLFSSLLKKDKNDWVLQKCTELGVRHFVPILSDRTEKTGFSEERAEKLVIEAAEQCGRSDIPRVREPIGLEAALHEFSGKIILFFAEKTDHAPTVLTDMQGVSLQSLGVFVGPEGGWTEDEKTLLAKYCQKLNLSDFTLRAETASVVAIAKLLQ